jgi:hypothetical protein
MLRCVSSGFTIIYKNYSLEILFRNAIRAPMLARRSRYTDDVFVSQLESRADSLMLRTGLFSSPHFLRQLLHSSWCFC